MDLNASKTDRSSSPQIEYVLIVFGWLASRIGLSIIRDYHICGLAVLPAILILLYNLFVLIKTTYREQPTNRKLCVISGLLSDAIPYWTLRYGSESRYEIMSAWDGRLWVVSFIFLVVVCGLWWITRNTQVPRLFNSIRYGIISTMLISVPILIVAFFRITYLMIRHLPNEERSVFLFGSEIHHAYIGALGIIICNAIASRRDPNLVYSLSLVLSISMGVIIDQLTYIMILHVTDAAYSSTLSWLGPIVGVPLIILTVCWFHFHTARPSRVHN